MGTGGDKVENPVVSLLRKVAFVLAAILRFLGSVGVILIFVVLVFLFFSTTGMSVSDLGESWTWVVMFALFVVALLIRYFIFEALRKFAGMED